MGHLGGNSFPVHNSSPCTTVHGQDHLGWQNGDRSGRIPGRLTATCWFGQAVAEGSKWVHAEAFALQKSLTPAFSSLQRESDPMTGIRYETDGAVAIITIDRPQARNSLDLAATAALGEAAECLGRDSSIRAAIITGAHGTFCAGADLNEMAGKGTVYEAWAGSHGPLANRPAK